MLQWPPPPPPEGPLCSVFFLPEKKKIFPRKFSIFSPRRFETSREKKLKTAREEKILPEKKTAKFYPRKKNSLPEKKNRNFPRQKYKKYLKILKFLPEKNKMQPEKKSENLPEKTKCNPRKNLKICPRKLHNARENLGKSGREKYFPPEKKTKKKAKYWFLGHFSFSRVKKKLVLDDMLKLQTTLHCAVWRDFGYIFHFPIFQSYTFIQKKTSDFTCCLYCGKQSVFAVFDEVYSIHWILCWILNTLQVFNSVFNSPEHLCIQYLTQYSVVV